MEAALLVVVVAFLLPLRLLSFVFRFHRGGGFRRADAARSAAALAAAAVLLAAIYAVPGGPAVHPTEGAAAEGFQRAVRSEMEELKLMIARLESVWKENSENLNIKTDDLEDDDKLIKAMGLDIQSLINGQESMKESLSNSYAEDNIKAMENEVQFLKEELGKMNSQFYTIGSLAKDLEKKFEALYSEVQKGFKGKKKDRSGLDD